MKKTTIIRTVLLLVALINLILNAAGKNTLPFTNEEISEAIATIFTVLTALSAWWKNNSFTKEAIVADEYMESLKDNEDRGGGNDGKTNVGLVAYCKAQLGKPYWYGCFGNISTKNLYSVKKKQYPDQYRWDCPDSQLNKRVHDCIGLIKGYLWSKDTNSVPVYNGNQDVSANGMRSKCQTGGTINTMPDVPGILVFMNAHVGVYIGNGKVIEARGHNYGVVETELKKRGWTHWGYCPWITYITEEKPAAKPSAKKTVETIAKEVIDGKWGTGETRKKKLTAAGYDYTAIQNKVNEMLKPSKKVKSNAEIAKEVIDGKWGNGEARKKKLTAAGYDYSAIQKEVNKLLRK